MTATTLLLPGDHAPWFTAPALSGSPGYAFQTVAGRPVLMLFMGSARLEPCAAALGLIGQNRDLFDDETACFFGITVDREDAAAGRIAQSLPGVRFFLDYDQAVSRAFGALPDGTCSTEVRYLPHWVVLDPALRVVESFPVDRGSEAIACLRTLVAGPPEPNWAPALLVPNVLEPELCRMLIALYEREGGQDSGFMRDVDGKTQLLLDPHHKQRRDCMIEDPALRARIVARMNRRLTPALVRAFQFEPTRIERYLVACYEAGAGHFRPHRDNTTKGTAHRQFAVTINLNAADYEGGDLRFPEYGRQTYRAPTGGAIVFSCSLLHEATPVTAGRRFAFLPFLYNEAAAATRAANNVHLGEGVGAYQRTTTTAPPA